MAHFKSNPRCGCPRCRLRGLMGPTVLVTLGILFLLDNMNVMDFNRSFPILLIVIGIVMVLQRTSSVEGHIPLGYMQPYAAPPQPPPQAPSDLPPDIPGPGAEGVHNG
jgi:LiaI-LiaF-like transmembrane region